MVCLTVCDYLCVCNRLRADLWHSYLLLPLDPTDIYDAIWSQYQPSIAVFQRGGGMRRIQHNTSEANAAMGGSALVTIFREVGYDWSGSDPFSRVIPLAVVRGSAGFFGQRVNKCASHHSIDDHLEWV